MRIFMKYFYNNESGATLVEYGVALILAIIVGGVALSNLAGETSENLVDACGAMTPVEAGTLITVETGC
ncbi:Flp family type IVb pilin [Boseongicola aestuarii]|uniref:Flp/Fap pilin component n=1 Tax=Boseongicola aestuarii TaxID=1470561 RepID=A0A238IVJ2_9RHOB|nr:hypothetical protein [Boseongicola aestuarii]SMX22041.1 hypothetical protein BOA8489_00128 [Boseongicola aestuarii]